MSQVPGPLDRYRPDPAWWLHDPWGIHGLTHAARVLVWADTAARHLAARGVAVGRAVVCWSAILHDCRRQDDGYDDGHGRRAAAWIGAEHARLFGDALSDAQVRAVRRNVCWHVPDDRWCPRMTVELKCLKDADGLDRVRLGDFDPRYLRLDALQRRIDEATCLMRRTRYLGGDAAWEGVRWVARELGYWPDR